MYRTLIPVFLYLGAVTAAPQDLSNITFVNIQPTLEDSTEVPSSAEANTENFPPFPAFIQSEGRAVKNDNDSEENATEVSETLETARNDHVTTEPSYESTEAVTEASEKDRRIESLLQQTEEYETKTKAPSRRFYSKLSYFQKTNAPKYYGGSFTNLLERSNKRRFRSRCRCERISNCPKLQISVPRCPEEHFMCCF